MADQIQLTDISDDVLQRIRRKWPIDDKTKVYQTTRDIVEFPMKRHKPDPMDLALSKAVIRVELILHAEQYSIDEQLAMSEYANDAFQLVRLYIEPITNEWGAGYHESGLLVVRRYNGTI